MTKEQWRPFEQCDFCGADAEVFTTCCEDETAWDGDQARCTECEATGYVVVDDATELISAHIEWRDPGDG